jgi:hypothetical protein
MKIFFITPNLAGLSGYKTPVVSSFVFEFQESNNLLHLAYDSMFTEENIYDSIVKHASMSNIQVKCNSFFKCFVQTSYVRKGVINNDGGTFMRPKRVESEGGVLGEVHGIRLFPTSYRGSGEAL